MGQAPFERVGGAAEGQNGMSCQELMLFTGLLIFAGGATLMPESCKISTSYWQLHSQTVVLYHCREKTEMA